MSPLIAHRSRLAARPIGALIVLTALTALMAGGPGARAQGVLTARYRIVMTGVTIGHLDWTVDIGAAHYTTTAHGQASGMLALLVHGKGAVAAQGTVANGHVTPVEFRSRITDDDGTTDLVVSFAEGVANVTATPPLEPTPERLPVTAADRRGVADPLSAMLIANQPGGNFLSADNCKHVLAIFDGRRRYDLALSFDRTDKVALKGSYRGPVLVCGLVLRPIAGYRSDSLLVKYVAGRRDMELWLAPIAGTALLAPIRLAMPTLIGTLKIQAERFDSKAVPAPPPSAGPPPNAPAAK